MIERARKDKKAVVESQALRAEFSAELETKAFEPAPCLREHPLLGSDKFLR
jgi:hypothetical protein